MINVLLEKLAAASSTSHALLVDAALKSFVVLALALLLLACCRKASAAMRHWIGLVALASLALLPCFSFVLPAWQKPVWAVSTEVTPGNELNVALQFAPGDQATVRSEEAPRDVTPETSAKSISASRASGIWKARLRPQWSVILAAVWVGGVALILLADILARIRLRTIQRRARPLKSGEWTSLVNELRAALGIRRSVHLLQSADGLMPMTWGSARPIIVLPAAAEHWPIERRRIVLLHELAHVKRWDCLTRNVATLVCAAYWCNPLAWLVARQMCIERERACDDLVLKGGCRASDYAGHLLEIARSFRRVPQVAAIAMARASGLEGRITAIVDASRTRNAPRAFLLALLCAAALGVVATLAAQKVESTRRADGEVEKLRQQQIARLQEFSRTKEKQSMALAARDGEKISPEFQRFFDAAGRGDFAVVTNMYADFKRRHPQYKYNNPNDPDESLHVSYWSPVLEISLAYFDVAAGDPKYLQRAVDDIIDSIPAGSIYFGGTDPGRGLPTAFSKSHADADPFFTLTQNMLSDTNYLGYLRAMYGGRIYVPTDAQSLAETDEYKADAQQRMGKGQLRPGEDVKVVNNRVETSGQVAVMAINARVAKRIFDGNPNHEFYLEESFPLDWMLSRLEPSGLILKINRQPLARLSEEVIARDRAFWKERVDEMIGPWLNAETSVKTVADFVDKVYVRKDLSGFSGNPRFVQNEYARKMFAKWRSAIAGVYSQRIYSENDPAEKQRLERAADFAFRQAYALCPSSAEALYRYVQLLASAHRFDEALSIAKASSSVEPEKEPLRQLIKELQRMKAQKDGVSAPAQTGLTQTKLEEAYRAHPNVLSNAIALAQWHASTGRTGEVLRIAGDLVANPQADAPMISFAAQMYQQFADYPKLETALQRWTTLTPTPEAWVDYAAAQAIQGKHNDALLSLEKALALNRQRLQKDVRAPNLARTLASDVRFVSLQNNPAFNQLINESQTNPGK